MRTDDQSRKWRKLAARLHIPTVRFCLLRNAGEGSTSYLQMASLGIRNRPGLDCCTWLDGLQINESFQLNSYLSDVCEGVATLPIEPGIYMVAKLDDMP